MAYDFTTLHPAFGSGAPMWGRLAEFGECTPDAIDFGVAEMKFTLAPEIAAALERHVTAGTFGYAGAPESLKREIVSWMERRHGWHIEPEWLFQTYGLVLAVGCCVRALTEPGDGILLNFPSYPPFYRAIEQNGRRLVRSELVERGGKYVFDFEDMERKIEQEQVKLYILCSPQNPTGRVWTREELSRVGEICLRHGVKVVSDEIHFDITYPGHEHSVFASISEELAANSVVLTAPSKTFNLAGLMLSNIIIRDEGLRAVWMDRHYNFDNPLSVAAAQAAYEKGEPWLLELQEYLDDNFDFVGKYLAEHLPRARYRVSEATYLAWVDLGEYFRPEEDLPMFFAYRAGVLLEGGDMFVQNSDCFIRLNLACPRATLEEGLRRICEAVNEKHPEPYLGEN